MNLLFDHFKKLIEAPDGIRKMREFILQQAVKGKLVPQDPNDEPASELLKKIKVENQKRTDSGEKKLGNVSIQIKPVDIPFTLPKEWKWCRLIDLLDIINGRAYKQSELFNKGTPVLRVGNLFTSKHWYYSDLKLEDEKYIDNGDLIYAWSASFGPFIWTGDRVIYHYHIWKLDLHYRDSIFNKFIYIYLLQKTNEIKASGHGISMAHMTKSKMEQLLFPLPPLNEQHRIVAKVDQLMSLCDELEKLKEKRDHQQLQMNKAALFALLNSQTPEELAEHWQRIVDHFGEFYHTPENVAELKKAILQLAVQGKLVSQDPNDEPASELLKKIKAEKQKFIVEGKIKKEKPLPPIKPEEIRYELPKGWVSCRLGEVTNYGSSDKIEPKTIKNDTWVLELEDIEKGTSKLLKRITNKYRQSKSTKSIFNKGDVLYGKLRPYLDKVLVAEENGVCTTEILPLRGYIDISPFYLRWYLKSPDFIEYANNSTHGMNLPRLGTEKGRDAIFLLPPFNEQLRIVAKVDELMGLCDELERRLSKSRESLEKALGSVVNGMS